MPHQNADLSRYHQQFRSRVFVEQLGDGSIPIHRAKITNAYFYRTEFYRLRPHVLRADYTVS